MKNFKFSFVALAFAIAISASAFKAQPFTTAAKQVQLKRDDNPMVYFSYKTTASNTNVASNYDEITDDPNFNPEEELCSDNEALCAIKVQAAQSQSPYTPDATALNALQDEINGAVGVGNTDNVFLRGQ